MHGDTIRPSRGFASGKVRLCKVSLVGSTSKPTLVNGKPGSLRLPGYWLPRGDFDANDVMYDWATIVGELLRNAPDQKPYHIGSVYFEYENNGGAPVSIPTITDRGDGIDYYNGLLADPNKDYLRVPLTAVTLTSTDEDKFPRGNELTFFAQTEGTAGVHGKPFNDIVQSRVFGGALVACPDFGDQTQDLVFSRFYCSTTAKQLIKIASSQLGLAWPISLE